MPYTNGVSSLLSKHRNLLLGNWRNEKFQLEMSVGGPRVNERHLMLVYEISSFAYSRILMKAL